MVGMHRFSVNPPRVPTDYADISRSQFVNADTFQKFQLKNTELSAISIRALDLREGVLENVALADAKLIKISASDVIFKRPDCTTADFSEGSLLRVSIHDGRMTGWDVNQAAFEDVLFRNCKLDMANFRATKLKRVHFSNCMMTEADFLAAELTDVRLESCILEKVEFSQCTMKNVDFRSSQLIDISGWPHLAGATIDNVQLTAIAPYLAHAMKINVADEN